MAKIEDSQLIHQSLHETGRLLSQARQDLEAVGSYCNKLSSLHQAAAATHARKIINRRLLPTLTRLKRELLNVRKMITEARKRHREG